MKWFIGILAFLLAALILDSGLLAFVTYVLFGLLLLSRFLAHGWMGGLEATRTCAFLRHEGEEREQAEPGKEMTAEIGEILIIRVRVKNQGWLPVPWVLLEDLLPSAALESRSPKLKVKGRRAQISMIRSRGEIILRYQIECLKRGCYQIGPMILENGDLWGLHRRYKLVTEPEYLLVYPRIVTMEDYQIASRRPIGDVQITHRLHEDPTRIAGVRPYEPGDPINRVTGRPRQGPVSCIVRSPSHRPCPERRLS